MTDQELEQQNTEDSVEQRVVNKVQRIIQVKKILSDRQSQHLQKLSTQKKGKKYVEKVPETEVELPTVVVPKKPRAPRVKPVIESESESEPEVVIVKKKKKRVEIIEETESEEEPEPVKKPKKKVVVKKAPAVVVKAPVKKVPAKKPVAKKVVIVEPIIAENKSKFRKSLF